MKASLKNSFCSPRKMSLAAELVRKKRADWAQRALQFTKKKSAFLLLKLLNSAIANSGESVENLFVETVLVGPGKKLRRFMPRAKGRADIIYKRYVNVDIKLSKIKKEEKNG